MGTLIRQPSDAEVRADASLRARFEEVRRASRRLVDSLPPAVCESWTRTGGPSVAWHLAHTTCLFEALLVEPIENGGRPFDPHFRERYELPLARPEVTRDGVDRILGHRRWVDERVLAILARLPAFSARNAAAIAARVELGLQHEQKHQELLLAALKQVLAEDPSRPAYREVKPTAPLPAQSLEWYRIAPGLRAIGAVGRSFADSDERPRHHVHVPGFEIASRLIRNAEFLAFMQDRGYERAELWLPDGWARLQREGRSAPTHWEKRAGEWWIYTLAGMRRLRMQEPVCHVSYYEADAFARWADARLPREHEWEIVAALSAVEGNLLEAGLLHPEPVPVRREAERVRGPAQLFGDAWEWTSSLWAPYSGYRAPSVEWGEYHGRFPVGEPVLRGGSCLTPRGTMRATRREHQPPWACQQVTGIRLVRDH